MLGGGVILFPSLALLFTLTLGRRLYLRGTRLTDAARRARPGAAALGQGGLPGRRGAADPGVGFLNAASAPWAHAIGVVCLFGFIIVAFAAIVPRALAEDGSRTEPDRPGALARPPPRPPPPPRPRPCLRGQASSRPRLRERKDTPSELYRSRVWF